MNKQEFIKGVAEEAGISQKDAGCLFEAVVNTIVKALKGGEKIQLVGFGNYELKKKAAREGINPQTKAKVKIAASLVPVFKFGKSFKEIFNCGGNKK